MKNITKNQQSYLKPVAKSLSPASNNLLILCAAAQFVEGKLLPNSSCKNFTHSKTGPFKPYTHVEVTNLQISNSFFTKQESKKRISIMNPNTSPGLVNLYPC